ncbi:WD40 repeat [Arabidopsis thaliana x Arabidopsis arenosa]|uniref:WD40 repeat n=1 Tax=Arabidopsis thaliana x Arabidopsis arenosa TaxID=1240361 RepID=A0A8T1ZL97_9BRAS|nr:WD40 repeat [Arabidopsis thaliana x Arabidopsis arenosa]
MESSRSRSVFVDIGLRELNGFRVRKRPFFADSELICREISGVAVEHDGNRTPPLAVSFCKTSRNSQLFAVSDEDGHVSLFNSSKKFASSATHQENTENARFRDWIAHYNAVFDISWIKGDSCLLTASGDQTIKVWDVEENKCTGVLIGHTGTVKSMCSHPTNSDLLVSGSRDGCFALWDLRCKSSSHKEEFCINSTGMVKGAHLSPLSKRIRRRKAASSSITSVLYLKDEITIATAGAPDSALKFWDTRKLKAPFAQASPQSDPTNTKEKRSHGIVSLSQDSSGTFLTASCKDNRIYLYNTLRLDKGPVQSFSGCRIDSFFVRTMISPDGEYVLSGSSDGNAYIWQVNKPQVDPIILKGHDFEVTAVDWSPSEIGKVATASDDFTVRLWNIENNRCTNTNATASVSRVKRRVTAFSNTEAKERLEMNRETESPQKHSSLSSDDDYNNNDQSTPIIRTPESQKKKTSSSSSLSSLSSSEEDIICERTPETTFNSPSSVLNPPSSVKRRTIRDYFLVTP